MTEYEFLLEDRIAVIVENIEFAESKKSGTTENKAVEAEFVNVSSDELLFT